MSEWKDYIDDRLIREEDGFVVIVPKNIGTITPISCPVCGELFRSRDDECSYENVRCCSQCAITWAYPHKSEWDIGWRPSTDVIEAALLLRSTSVLNVDVE